MYNSAPYAVPQFLPQFLFLSPGSEYKKRNTIDNRLDDVFSGQNRLNF